MSARPMPRSVLALLLAALLSAGCDRLVNRSGRDPAKGCELGLVSACMLAGQAVQGAAQKRAYYARGCNPGQCLSAGAATRATSTGAATRAIGASRNLGQNKPYYAPYGVRAINVQPK